MSNLPRSPHELNARSPREHFSPAADGADNLVRGAWAAIDQGDLFTAYDIAARADAAGNPALSYIKALALARMGDWRGALGVYQAEGLDRRDDVDSLTLKARLLKDRAFDADPAERGALLRQARDAYLTAFDRTGEDFAAINTASLSLMAGDPKSAHEFAHALVLRNAQGSGPSNYWEAANAAEALLILGRFEEGRRALEKAITLPLASAAARSSTFVQLTRLLAAQGKDDKAWLDGLLRPIRPRRIAHFCGMMFTAQRDTEAGLAQAVAQALRSEDVGMAFGALACGADIVIAEQALAMGIELHAVLPFEREDFVRESVVIGGSEWLGRFDRCIAAAAGVHMATTMRFVNDDHQFEFGSRTAMGLARVRAAQMHAETVQIAVCNDQSRAAIAGTAADIAIWRAAGGRTRTIPVPGAVRPALSGKPGAADRPHEKRSLRVLVFADFQGFSRLAEQDIPRFWQTVMAGCAEALKPYEADIMAANTWGDGLHIVFGRVDVAASALIALWEAMRRRDPEDLATEEGSGMRIAAHFGSVYEMTDPVTGRMNFYGTEVSRAARLEPITPPGSIYITEPMAAAIEMTPGKQFQSRYVGRLSLPKNFGTERIYSLEALRPT